MISINTPNGQFFGGTAALGYLDGTIVTDVWSNNVQGEFLSILAAAGIQPDATNYAQVLAALTKLFGGGRRLGAPAVFDASGNVPPVPGATGYLIEAVGAGGSGGGAPSTAANQGSAGGGGGAGAYGAVWVTAAQFAAVAVNGGVPVSVGAAAAFTAGAVDGPGGGGTNVGNGLLACPGGLGGLHAAATGQSFIGGAPASNPPTSTVGLLLVAKQGAGGGLGIVMSPTSVVSGTGGAGPWGTGGDLTNAGYALNGSNATGRGAGGSGGACIQNAGVAGAGGIGSPGRVIVTAFS